jgi:membrane associated rhomboid family serine protease
MYTEREFSGYRKQGGFLDTVIGRLVIANAVMFVLTWFPLGRTISAWLALTPQLVVKRGFIWQLITYMFVHGSLMHLGLNMFVIWMFGRTLEQVWGARRFLTFYFACGLGGALFSFIFAYNTSVIGASAASYGILLAFAIMFPNQRLLLWFVIPVKARTLAIGLAVISLLLGVRGGGSIAHFAHLGGMAAALVMMRGEYQFRRVRNWVLDKFAKMPVKVSFGDDDKKPQKAAEDTDGDMDKINSILDKISEKGYENLSETERRILEKYSEEQNRPNPEGPSR